MRSLKKSKGITLIALVVTVVVLIIIASISIATLIGDNSTIENATEAKIWSELSEVDEAYNLYLVQQAGASEDGTVDRNALTNVLTKVSVNTGGGTDSYIYVINNLDEIKMSDSEAGRGTIQTTINDFTDLNDVYIVDKNDNVAYVLKDKIYGDIELAQDEGVVDDSFWIVEDNTIVGINPIQPDDDDKVGYYYNASGEKILSYENITIPAEVNGEKITKFDTKDLNNASNLNSVIVSEGIEVIGYLAFKDCYNMKSITLPNSLKRISSRAFKNCSSLTSITIPENVTISGGAEFQNCTSLTNLTIPSSVTLIDYGPDQIYNGGYTFAGCTSLTNLILPSNTTYINRTEYQGCTSLKSITIPKNVTYINASAFSSCSNLTEIIIEKGSTLTVPTGKWGATNATITYK